MASRKISEQEQLERRAVIQSNLASHRMEGLEPDSKVIEDCEKWACGEMTIADAIAGYKARIKAAQSG